MTNKWVEHVKAYAVKNNISYSCAMSMPDCKASYNKKAESPEKIKKDITATLFGLNAKLRKLKTKYDNPKNEAERPTIKKEYDETKSKINELQDKLKKL
jgi:hypothetical protein